MKWSERFWMFALFVSFALVGAVIAGIFPARAADLPRAPALKAAPVVVAPNPFYIGLLGGIGLSPTENEATFPGISTGVQKAWPTGILAGGVVGYANTSGPLYWGVAFEAAYDFSRGGVSCGAMDALMTGVSCPVTRKNGLLLQEVGELGISMSTLAGYIPNSAQPANWPVPIIVPASVWSNIVIAARGGLAQRDIQLCAVTGLNLDGTAVSQCGSKFYNAPSAGLKVKFMASAQTEIFATWDHVFWKGGSTFTPSGAIPLFQNAVSLQGEDLFKGGFGYHF